MHFALSCISDRKSATNLSTMSLVGKTPAVKNIRSWRTLTTLPKGQTTSNLSPPEIEQSLERLNKFRHLNAFTFVKPVYDDNQLGPHSSNSPLIGKWIAVKDNFCVEGLPATCGSKMLTTFVAPYNATVVEKLINNGAVIVGKSNMDEFGMGNGSIDTHFGPVKNIWGLEKFRTGNGANSFEDFYVAGGSSGGSAVAVASGMCFGAIGSDTGGSTRNPASYCGVVALKPTYGSVSRHGLIPLVNSMDVPGVLTRTVKDCALIFDTIKGWDPRDSTSTKLPSMEPTIPSNEFSVRGVRIGIPKEFQCEGMSSEVIDCWRDTADLLEKEGAQVEQVSLPHTKYSIVCYSVLNPCEVASNMARYDGLRYGHRAANPKLNSTESLYARSRHEGFNSVVRGRILSGNYFLLKSNYSKYYLQAAKLRRLILEDYDKVWKQNFQVLLTPCTLTTAPKYSDFIKWDNRTQSSIQDYCTQPANMAGIPAVSLPIQLSDKTKLPISLQLIGPKHSEKILFDVGHYLEKLLNFNSFGWMNKS